MERNINELLEKAMELDRRIAQKLIDDYPNIKYLAGDLLEKQHIIGLKILADTGNLEFTFYYDGLFVQQYKEGLQEDISVQLAPNFHCKPIVQIKDDSLRAMLDDEEYFLSQPFEAVQKYLPDITMGFLR